jgi:streptomycin 6-kinase
MPQRDSLRGVPTAEDLGRSLDRRPSRAADPIPPILRQEAAHIYRELCVSQSRPRLLHGDLHHHNILLDSARGWLAVDPKGVIAELEYEAGAMLRNPLENPELFLRPATIESRVTCFADELHLDPERMLAWSFAQAVRSAIWLIEDGFEVGSDHPWILLAATIRRELTASWFA